MLATFNALVVLATEGGVPASDWRAKLAVPIGIVLFVGSVYLLLRSNLGSRRGYLVMATSLWGFMVIYALFWTFGAPGTPPATGPQNLPGQELDAYDDVWRGFAGDSLIAADPAYDVVKTFPEGFSETPEAAGLPAGFGPTATLGVGEIQTFFSTETANLTDPPIGATWVPVEGSQRFARAENGRPILAVTYTQTYQIAPAEPDAEAGAEPVLTPDGAAPADDGSNVAPPGTEVGDPVEGGETYTAFGFFDAGSPLFPSLVVLGIVSALFALHAALLARDESREHRERAAAREAAAGARQRETVGAARAG